MQSCASALNFAISCNSLGLLEPFDYSYLGHALSKVCQYATIDEKMCISLSYAFIKDVQGAIQKCITWPENQARVGKLGIKFTLILN